MRITASRSSRAPTGSLLLAAAGVLDGLEVAQAIQLGIEYDPQPPFDSGSTEKAAPEIVELVRSVAAARRARNAAGPAL